MRKFDNHEIFCNKYVVNMVKMYAYRICWVKKFFFFEYDQCSTRLINFSYYCTIKIYNLKWKLFMWAFKSSFIRFYKLLFFKFSMPSKFHDNAQLQLLKYNSPTSHRIDPKMLSSYILIHSYLIIFKIPSCVLLKGISIQGSFYINPLLFLRELMLMTIWKHCGWRVIALIF